MDELSTILIVDDDPMPRLLFGSALFDSYRVIEAADGESVQELARAENPALILLDIAMAGIDGYETCRRLRAEPGISEIPVIFVSAEITQEDRLAAYAAGGDDFIGKPVHPDELRAKIAITIKHASERQRLSGDAQAAFSTAMTAMSAAGEQGVVIDALRKCLVCGDLEGLADAILASCAEYGLDACIRVDGKFGTVFRSLGGMASGVEVGVLNKLTGGDPILSLGRQTVFNYGGLTLLIKTMPVSDPDQLGRMRDNLALIVSVGDARLQALNNELMLNERKLILKQLLERALLALADIDGRYQANRATTEQILQDMLDGMGVAFFRLGLTDEQEEAVQKMLVQSAKRISGLYQNGLSVADHLAALRGLVDASATKLH